MDFDGIITCDYAGCAKPFAHWIDGVTLCSEHFYKEHPEIYKKEVLQDFWMDQ